LHLTWTIPGDIDFVSTKIEFLTLDKVSIGEDYIYTIGEYTTTLSSSTKYIRLSTRDRKDNNSDGIVYAISGFKNITPTTIQTPPPPVST
jgi:hypothetical protein